MPKQWRLYQRVTASLENGVYKYYAWVNEHDIVVHARSVAPMGHIIASADWLEGMTHEYLVHAFRFKKVRNNNGISQENLSKGYLV